MILSTPRHALTQASATAEPTADENAPKIVGYFVQWGVYARNYRIRQVETSGAAAKLTHLNYAFANVSTDLKCYEETRAGWGDAYADYGWLYKASESVDNVGDVYNQNLKGHFNQIKKLKAMHPNLKALISIGGWTWSGRFSDAALPEHREAFVKSCIDLFIRGNLPQIPGNTAGGDGSAAGIFDGIDIDWEFVAAPAFPGDPSRGIPPHVYRPEDTQNFTALLAEFRKQLDQLGAETGKHYLLTIAAPAEKETYEKIELGKIYPYLDFINVMTYDYHGSWDKNGPTNFNAPLYSSPDDPSAANQGSTSVDATITDFLRSGIPAKKLIMGIPFYGRGWTNVPDQNHGLYQSGPSVHPANGKYEAGIEDYKVLKAMDAPSFRDPKTQSFWIFDGKTWWNYDDPTVIAAKMQYVKTKGLGGTMVWSLDSDDGTLVNAIYEGLKG